MTRDELEYQGGYMRERMEEIKNEIKDEYFNIRNFDDPMDHYTGYDSTMNRVDNWIEEKAREYGVSYDLMAEACNEIDREELDSASKEYEWANTPGNLTSEEYDAYMMGELNISDRINSGCHGKDKKDKKKKKAVKSSMTLDKIKALHYPAGWESGTVDVMVVEGDKLGVRDSSYPGYERWIDVDKFDNYSVWDKDGNIWQITRTLWNSKQIKSSYPKTDKQNSFNWSYNSWIGRFVDDLAYTDRYLEGVKWFDNNKSSLDALCKEYDCYPVSDNEKAAFYNALREVGEITSSYRIKSSTDNQSNVSRDDVENELDRVLVKKHLHLDKNVRDETIDYILSFFDEEYPPKDVKEAVSEWYRDTKKNFPDVFEEGEGKKIASSRYLTYIRSIYVNPRDEYLKMQGRNMRENQITLSQGKFDDAMDNSGEWIRGYYKWTSDSHNWGRQIDVGISQVVSYSTDSNVVFISIVEDSTKNKLARDKNYGLNYNEVMDICQKQMDNWYNYMAD